MTEWLRGLLPAHLAFGAVLGLIACGAVLAGLAGNAVWGFAKQRRREREARRRGW